MFRKSLGRGVAPAFIKFFKFDLVLPLAGPLLIAESVVFVSNHVLSVNHCWLFSLSSRKLTGSLTDASSSSVNFTA